MENMEYDILTKLADFIDSQMKDFMTAYEEAKELQYACNEIGRISDKLKLSTDDLKRKIDQKEVSIIDFKNFKDEFIQGIKEIKDEINYSISLFNSLLNKNALDLSKINVNNTFEMFYKTLNDLDDLEKSIDITYE